MPKKIRQTISRKKHELIRVMARDERYSINEIARIADVNWKTVSQTITNIKNRIKYKSASTKKKKTCAIRNSTFSAVEQYISNEMAYNNVLVQKKIQVKVAGALNISISQPTVSRKLKKLD